MVISASTCLMTGRCCRTTHPLFLFAPDGEQEQHVVQLELVPLSADVASEVARVNDYVCCHSCRLELAHRRLADLQYDTQHGQAVRLTHLRCVTTCNPATRSTAMHPTQRPTNVGCMPPRSAGIDRNWPTNMRYPGSHGMACAASQPTWPVQPHSRHGLSSPTAGMACPAPQPTWPVQPRSITKHGLRSPLAGMACQTPQPAWPVQPHSLHGLSSPAA